MFSGKFGGVSYTGPAAFLRERLMAPTAPHPPDDPWRSGSSLSDVDERQEHEPPELAPQSPADHQNSPAVVADEFGDRIDGLRLDAEVAMRREGVAVIRFGRRASVKQRDRVTVDVSTRPSISFAAKPPFAAENVPMLVPISQTGTRACFLR